MRGKGAVLDGVIPALRITPACAGKRSVSSWAICPAWDHPRVCGEKAFFSGKFDETKGSPPRVRGKGNESAVGLVVQRITPACAGKSCPPQAPTFTRQDHPRVCGEKLTARPRPRLIKGSPPRVRGKACRCPPLDTNQRITPACAGKRSGWPAVLSEPRDHPRVCGEKMFGKNSNIQDVGSSPRVRGKVPSSI